MSNQREFDELFRQLTLEAYTGPLTAGISGEILDFDPGVTRAKCPLCPHVIEIVGRGFLAFDASGDDDREKRALVMCGSCLAFLFVKPPGFAPISRREFKKLPKDIRVLLERTRETVRTRGALL